MKPLLVPLLFVILFNFGFCSNINLTNTQIDSTKYYSHLANHPKTNTSLIKAYEFFNKAFNENIRLKDTSAAIYNLRYLSIIQFGLGDYHGCETNAVNALRLLEGFPENSFSSECKVGIYVQLGRVHYTLMSYDEAIKDYRKALKHAINPININIIKNNIGLIYMDQLHYQKAEHEFMDVYQKSLLLDDKEQIARALDNLGYVQLKLGRPEALKNLEEGLQIRLNIEDVKGIYSSYKNLSIYHNEKGNRDDAEQYAQKAYRTAKLLNSASFLEDALSHLISLNPNPVVTEYQKLKDSIDKAEQIAENKYALTKFNYRKQEQIANENKIKYEQERANKILYQGVGGLILISSIFTFLIIRARHRKEKIQAVYNTESRISKKVHDELANDVYQIMTKLQSKSKINEDMLDDLEAVYSKTRDISKENSPIEINDDYENLLRDLFSSYNIASVNVITKGFDKMDWATFDDIKKITLYRVLQELLVNMKKHSLCTNVVISFKKVNGKTVILYADNGNGCDIKKGSGLWNVENRIKSISGTIIFESEPNRGFKATITV